MTSFAYSGGALNNLVGNTPGANVSNLVTLLNDLKNFLNAPNLDGTNIADIPEGLLALALQQKLGLNDGAQIGRGKSIIATSEARTNVAYGTLTTPDQVAGVVLPADGILFVAFHALWASSVATAGRAAIFLGSTQVQQSVTNVGLPQNQECASGQNVNVNSTLFSYPLGLNSNDNNAVNQADVTTGQIIGGTAAGGGVCAIKAAAGTYTVSVRFKSASGSVTVQNRNLWVWSIGF